MINLLQVQKDLYNAISDLGYNVVDEPTINTEYPFIKIGYSYVENINIKQKEAYTLMQYIDVFSTYKGSKEVKEITYTIHDSISKKDFSTSDYTVNSKLYHMEFLEETDPKRNEEKYISYRHGVLIYKFNIYE